MFAERLTETPFTNYEANGSGLFDRITFRGDDPPFGDHSSDATLRALLFPRMKPDEKLEWAISNMQVELNLAIENMRIVENRLTIINCIGRNKIDENIKQKFLEKNSTFRTPEKINSFLAKQFPSFVAIDVDHRNSIIFVEDLDLRKLRRLQMIFLLVLPWFLERKPLDETENRLIKSLKEATSTNYKECLNILAENIGIKHIFQAKVLGDFCLEAKLKHIRSQEMMIEDLKRKLERHYEEIGRLLAQKERTMIYLAGLKARKEDAGEAALIDYIRTNGQIEVRKSSSAPDSRILEFVVKSQYEYYDAEMLEAYLNNTNSYLYEYSHYFSDDNPDGGDGGANMALLLRAMFKEEKIKLRTCAAFRFNFDYDKMRVFGVSCYTFGDETIKKYLPNPHINQYSCLGSYEPTICEALASGDLIMAMEQCVASTVSLNIGDSAVMGMFLVSLGKCKNKVLVAGDKEMTVREALEYLKEEAKQASE